MDIIVLYLRVNGNHNCADYVDDDRYWVDELKALDVKNPFRTASSTNYRQQPENLSNYHDCVMGLISISCKI